MRRLAIITALTASLWGASTGPAQADGWSWPVRGEILTTYRNAPDPYAGGQHRGIDIGAAVGTPVGAAAAGTVSFAGVAGSSGMTVSVRTADGGFLTSYLHLSSIAVKAGEAVGAGDRLGAVGTTGRRSADPPHLHFGVRTAGGDHGYRDPLDFLPPPPGPAPDEPPRAPGPAPAPARPAPGPAPAPVPAPGTVKAPRALPAPRGVPTPAGSSRRGPARAPAPAPVAARRPVPGAASARRPVTVLHRSAPGRPRPAPEHGPARARRARTPAEVPERGQPPAGVATAPASLVPPAAPSSSTQPLRPGAVRERSVSRAGRSMDTGLLMAGVGLAMAAFALWRPRRALDAAARAAAALGAWARPSTGRG